MEQVLSTLNDRFFAIRDLSTKPDSFTSPGVHETVLELLKNEKTGRMLDAGAGEGDLTRRLIQMGFDVEACDLLPEQFKLANRECKKVDFNKALPYSNGSFDFIVCVEVIEHLRNPWHLISEFKRILKKKGKLIITTPNILSVLSRLRFLFTGEYANFIYDDLWKEIDNNTNLHGHINPITFVELEYILLKNGLRLEKIGSEYRSGKLPYTDSGLLNRCIAMVAYPFIKAFMRKHYGKNSLLNSDELLNGEILIVKAAKQ